MLTEIENGTEDYQGIDPTHVVPLETKLVTTDRSSRIVVPAYGSFFTDSLQVRDINSKLPLTLGRDFKIGTLDERATLKSGKEVITCFILTNANITGIEYAYRYVGGLHSNGKYLLDILKKQYPDGIDPNKHWDHIKNKPDQFKGKPHQHSAHDTYGYDEAKRQLSRVVVGVNHGTDKSLANMYVRADMKLNELEAKTTQEIADIRAELLAVFEALRVQQGEYIFTDSLENPSIIRGYGTWVRLANMVLRGAQSDLIVGDGTIISTGSRQALRNTYIWLNKDTGVQPTASLFVDSSLIVNQVINVRENQEFEIGVQSSSMAEGTRLDWVIEGISDEFIDETLSKRFGTFVLDNLGRAKQKIRFKDDPNNIGDRTCVFMLEHLFGVKYNIKIIDSVRARWCELAFTHDPAGNVPAIRVNEGNMVYLQVKFHGYNVGETVYLDWTASTIPDYDFDIKPLSMISATASTLTMGVKIKANELTDGERALVVYAKDAPEEAISNTNPMAYTLVSDVSTGVNVQIDFKKGNQIITNVGEGETFDVLLTTNLPTGSVVELIYESSKALSEFTGLVPSATVGSNGRAQFTIGTLVDFLTNDGVQLLKLTALVNQKNVSENTMIIRDTSQTPNYNMTITRPNQTATVAKINEGESFWVRIKVSGWTNPSNPPTLVFGYGLDGDFSQNSGVAARVQSTFHSQLEFSNSSAVYDDVDWANGELIIKMTAIADHQFSGSKPFNIAMKQSNMDQFLLQASVMIMDTSVLDMTSAWSSSAVILNPITQVNEMQSDGTNNTMYLWMDVEGDGSLFGDITIQAAGNVTPTLDLVTVFPAVTRFGTGKTRHIFAVTITADFLNEGNEQLICYGTYVDANGVTTEIFRNTITIIDNSIQTPLDVKLSTSPTDPNAASANGKYSEYQILYAHISFPTYSLDTNIEWQVTSGTGGSASGQFMSLSGTAAVATGVPSVVVSIHPVADRVQDGEFYALFKSKRVLQSNSKVVGTGPDKPFTLLDDSLALTVDTKFYKDAGRTIEAYIFNEGDTVYGRTNVSNPGGNFYLMNNIVRPTTSDDGTYIQLGVDSDVVNYPDQRKVRQTYTLQNSNVTYTDDFQFTLNRNRKTAARPQVLEVGGIVVHNDSPRYNVGDVTTLDWNSTSPQSKKTITVNDTSKATQYHADFGLTATGPRVSDVDEGEYFVLSFYITSGEPGDVYTIMLGEPLGDRVLDFDELGLDQIQSLANDKINWRFRAKLDRDTNLTSAIHFTILNKTTGLVAQTIGVPINDIYKTPVLEAKYFLLYNGTYYTPNPISERTPPGGQQYLVVVGDQYLLSDDAIKLSHLAGRAKPKWDPVENWDKPFPVVALGTDPRCPPEWRDRNGVIIPIKPSQDRLTNPPADLTIDWRVSAVATSAKLDMHFDITDASQTRSFLEVRWVDSNGNPISSVNEGESATLRVRVSGGEDDIDVKVENNGGRSVGRLTQHSYGVVKSRDGDTQVMSWTFVPALDHLSNTGNETKLAVRISVLDTPALIRDIELPINDTSVSATGSVTFHAQASTNVITSLPEGSGYGPVYYISNPNPNGRYRMITNSQRAGTEWKVDTTLFGYQLINNGGTYYYKFQRNVYADSKTNTPEELYIISELWDVDQNVMLASGQLTIIDTSNDNISAEKIRITDPMDGGHAHLSSVNEGRTVRLWFDPLCFPGWSGGRWYKWWVGDGTGGWSDSVQPQTGNILQGNLAADGSYSVDVQIPADETTNAARSIRVFLETEYPSGNTYSRGTSEWTSILDTSPVPSIRAVFFATDPNPGDNPSGIVGGAVTVNEGDTIYVHVWAKGLTADGSPTNVNLNWGGTATAPDFNAALPTQVAMNLWDASIREYKGVAGPIVIKKDRSEG